MALETATAEERRCHTRPKYLFAAACDALDMAVFRLSVLVEIFEPNIHATRIAGGHERTRGPGSSRLGVAWLHPTSRSPIQPV